MLLQVWFLLSEINANFNQHLFQMIVSIYISIAISVAPISQRVFVSLWVLTNVCHKWEKRLHGKKSQEQVLWLSQMGSDSVMFYYIQGKTILSFFPLLETQIPNCILFHSRHTHMTYYCNFFLCVLLFLLNLEWCANSKSP